MYNDKELEIIKSTFAENEELLIVLRKLFLGAKTLKAEKELVKGTFSKPELVKVVQRKIYGQLDVEVPIGELNDFWLGAETQIYGAEPHVIKQTVESKAKVLEMFTKAVELLADPDGEPVSIDYSLESLESDPLQSGLVARNLYIKAIETALRTLQIVAGQKTESVEETKKRLKQDSTR